MLHLKKRACLNTEVGIHSTCKIPSHSLMIESKWVTEIQNMPCNGSGLGKTWQYFSYHSVCLIFFWAFSLTRTKTLKTLVCVNISVEQNTKTLKPAHLALTNIPFSEMTFSPILSHVSLPWSSWPKSAGFFALHCYHMIGRLDMCMNKQLHRCSY